MFEAYAAVERTYSQGRYEEALRQAEALLATLTTPADEQLRPRLQLLMGHCHLYGLEHPGAAAAAYEAVLASCREPVLREIAEDGLGRCRNPEGSPATRAAAETAVSGTTGVPATDASPAMPWLERLDGATAAPSQPAALDVAPFQRGGAASASTEGLADPAPAPITPPPVEPELIIPEVVAAPEPEPPPRSSDFTREEEEELARGLLLVEL